MHDFMHQLGAGQILTRKMCTSKNNKWKKEIVMGLSRQKINSTYGADASVVVQ